MKLCKIYVDGFYVGTKELTRNEINKLTSTAGIAVVEE